MNPETEQKIASQLVAGTNAISMLNREGNILPFGYYSPESEGTVSWYCDRDADGKITSVFDYKNGVERDKNVSYLNNEQEAIFYRDTLINNGWKPIEMPKINFLYPGGKGMPSRPLTRKEKRQVAKKIEGLKGTNPLFK